MRVCISGGTGSLGRTLINRLATNGADRIVTFSRDEMKRATLAAEFAWHPGVKVYAGDVRDPARLIDIMGGCEVVIHAAARKVVSGQHDEPREMLQTNVMGTMNMVAAARAAGVGKFLFVSSDKAVQAENVYGVSKAMAEHLVISENARTWPNGPRLSVIRYGNVLASTGSVLQVWRKYAERKEAVPMSDTRMTRFWLRLDHAADFVLRAVADMRGGEVFVPLLKAAPLTRLAEAVGATAWEHIGIRPGGEKLHEVLVSADEARRAIARNGFIVIQPTSTTDIWDASPWLGERVPEGFTYQSDTWSAQWTVDELRDEAGGA